MVPATSVGAPERDPSPESENGTQTVTGTVVHTESRWDDPSDRGGGRIFTYADIALPDGSTMTVRQPGGTVGDIGMVQFPSPPLLQRGDQVQARVARLATGAGWSVLEVPSLVRAPRPGSPTEMDGDIDGEPGKLDPANRMITEPSPHRGFVRTVTDGRAPLYWGSGCAYIVFDSQGTTHIEGEGEFELMEQALAHWRTSTESCSYMEFVIEDPRPMEVGFDGFNVVKFREDQWCRPPPEGQTEPECHAPNAAGLTTLTFINNTESSRYGEILDADIELNAAVTFSISADGETLGPVGRELADLGNTFTHEVGHFLGLDHACRVGGEAPRLDHEGNEVPLCSGALLEATMHPTQESGETKKASIEQDDIDGACSVHPLAEDPNRCKAVDLTPERSYCTVSPAGSAAGSSGTPGAGSAAGGSLAALGLLLGAMLLRRRASARAG